MTKKVFSFCHEKLVRWESTTWSKKCIKLSNFFTVFHPPAKFCRAFSWRSSSSLLRCSYVKWAGALSLFEERSCSFHISATVNSSGKWPLSSQQDGPTAASQQSKHGLLQICHSVLHQNLAWWAHPTQHAPSTRLLTPQSGPRDGAIRENEGRWNMCLC